MWGQVPHFHHMLIKTITDSKLSSKLIEQIIADPLAFRMMMNIIFFFNIIFFIISMASISYLFVVRPENIVFYFPPVILFTVYLKILLDYREYFDVFLESFRMSYDILNKITSLTDEETEEFFVGINEHTKQKFLEQKRILIKKYEEI
jgi:hypothetical protein